MPKQKLRRFGEIKEMDFVLEYPYSVLEREDFPYKGKWREDFFQTPHPLVLELGCGGGEYTVALAEREPMASFVGVDRKGDRIWRGAKEVQEKRLRNVAFLRTDINIIDRFFEKEEVDALWITFPDPMMKKSRRRLISSYYFEKYRRFLKQEAMIRLKTDSPFLYQYTLDLLEVNSISPRYATNNLYNSPQEIQEAAIPDVRTRYEQQWLERGMSIKFIAFSLPLSEVSFKEPPNEPPRDDYRSLCRGSQKYQEEIAKKIRGEKQ